MGAMVLVWRGSKTSHCLGKIFVVYFMGVAQWFPSTFDRTLIAQFCLE